VNQSITFISVSSDHKT